MSESQLKITFQPHVRSVFVLRGTTILEAAARAGVVIATPCGGGGTCGKCRVQIISNANPPTDSDEKTFPKKELKDGWRLACQNRVENEMTIFIPQTSLFGDGQKIVTSSGFVVQKEVRPAIRKIYVELAEPTLEDDAPDLFRLEKATETFRTSLSLVQRVPSILRSNNFKGTAVLADDKLIGFEAGGFGNFIRRSSAQRIGLLPAGIDHQKIRYVGNVSLAGAKAALLSTTARRDGEQLARRVKHVDLSTADGFQEEFAEAMLFPDIQ